MSMLLPIAVGIIPVFIFLSALVFLDSYKLVRFYSILKAIFAGSIVGIVCYFINTEFLDRFELNYDFYSRYLSPVIEESFKAIYFVYLMKRKKIGFMVDGSIYGFAIGAGFAVIENIDYSISLPDASIFLWIIRGFGTAVMHGGTTSILAILSINISERRPSPKLHFVLPGLACAIAIHSFFNASVFGPHITTAAQLVILPLLIAVIFTQSEKTLREWLELGMDTDVLILEHIIKGKISETKIGRLLDSMKGRFPGEVVADMLCYLRVYLELAIRAKGMLMMQGVGFKIPVDEEIREKFTELGYLEKSIGKTGKLAIAPFLHGNTRDLWQMYLIDR